MKRYFKNFVDDVEQLANSLDGAAALAVVLAFLFAGIVFFGALLVVWLLLF